MAAILAFFFVLLSCPYRKSWRLLSSLCTYTKGITNLCEEKRVLQENPVDLTMAHKAIFINFDFDSIGSSVLGCVAAISTFYSFQMLPQCRRHTTRVLTQTTLHAAAAFTGQNSVQLRYNRCILRENQEKDELLGCGPRR